MARLADLARAARVAPWLLGFTLAAASASAQVGSGSLTGVIRDPSGAVLPGVSITATAVGTSTSRTAVTGAAGIYLVPGLKPGVYRLRAELAGFRPVVSDGVPIATGETIRLDLALEIGSLTDEVTVSTPAPLLRREDAGLGEVIEHDAVTRLPLNGRTFISLAALAPGVAVPPGSLLPRINGGRPRTNEYLFDGISVLQPEPGQVAFFPVIDAIQEFKIESNVPRAEFGRFNGGVINLTTRAGTNTLHGDGFEFLRNEALNARNAFASTTFVKPRFRRGQFGGVLGGPLWRDRTFFFADYQGQRQIIGRIVISTVPTVLQRQGIFTESIAGRVPSIYDPDTTRTTDTGFERDRFLGNMIPTARMDRVALALLQRYPVPTASGTANNYRHFGDEIDNQDQFDVRLDHRLSTERDQMFARLSSFRDRFVPVTPLPDGSGVTIGTLGPQNTAVWAFASNYQHVFPAQLLNELRGGDTRRRVRRTPAPVGGDASRVLGLPGIPSSAQFPDTLPTFLISGYQQLGSPPNTASDFSTSVTELVDALTWVIGRHTMKAGLDFRWERLNVIQPPSPTGSFQFSSLFTDLPGVPNTGAPLASFLLGEVQTFSIDLQQRQIRNRARIQEYFVQDDWRLSDYLTINAGLRYTLNFPSTEKHNQAAVFDLQTQQLEYLGQDGNPRATRELHKLNLGPRLGIVGQVNDKTVLSTAYGLVWIEQAGITTPFTTPVFPFLQTVSQRTLDNLTPAFMLAQGPTVAPISLTPDAGLGQGVFAVDRKLGSGYVQQWNLTLQRELTAHLSLGLSYVGSKITHVGIPDTNLNQLSVAQLTLGQALLQRVPNPFFGEIPKSSSLGDPTIPFGQLLKPYPQFTTVSLYRNNVGTTIYHGLEARLQQRLSRGVTYQASYTRSKLIDDASSVFDASILTGPIASYPVADSFNRKLERDYSTGDIPHVFVSSVAWELPMGAGWRHHPHGLAGVIVNDWTITGILTAQSGIPIGITQATNFNAFAGFGTQRPNLVGEPRLPTDQRSAGRWFNTEAFTTAPQFTIGTSSRNPVRGPAYRNLDLAIVRRVPLARGASLEIRGEVFNLMNTPPLGAPNGVFDTAAFGTITTAGDPRVIQLAVKASF